MSKKLSLNDFRAVRIVLEPDDFALGGDEPDPAPSDPISVEAWSGITGLSDDVAIRTSDHNGKALGEAYWLWGRWIEAIGETEDALFAPMCNSQQYTNWRHGSVEFKFGTACDQLSKEPVLDAFNTRMRAAGYQSLWDAKQGPLPGGYARQLYGDLCNYAHSRPGFTDGDLRGSNGPIYVGRVFLEWYYAYLRTISLCSISMFLARSSGDRSAFADLFTDDPNVLPPDLLAASKLV